MGSSPRWVAVALIATAGLGVATGCLTTLAPDIRARGHHPRVCPQDRDEDCLACHEPERAAHERLRAMSAAERDEAMDEMMSGGGAALVAQWMIDDPRGCQGCHVVRGMPR